MASPVMQLKCQCNNYPWGHQGKDSVAARLCEKTPGTDFQIDDSKSYAEMWMGTYPVLPSYILSTGEDLQEVLNKNTHLLGPGVLKKYDQTNIPYLPKVLSIAKALPLQVHPNKDLAARLHAKNPDQFTDPNHKPEIAVALGEFEAFCGWKTQKEIESLFALECLQKYLPQQSRAPHEMKNVGNVHLSNETLRNLVQAILQDSDGSIASVQDALSKVSREKLGDQAYILDLLPRLQSQYDKSDPGNLVALLTMNYLKLPARSSVYIPADCPHAYLSGDIIECMARSNNVLNTGFCPRADRDSIPLFSSTLTFASHSKDDVILPPKPWARCSSKGAHTVVYDPPMGEFSMLLIDTRGKIDTSNTEGAKVVGGPGSEKLEKLDGPSIFIVTKGKGKLKAAGGEHDLSEGYVFFVGQGTEMEFEGEVEVYLAFVE